jgi:hypothetical protein
MAYSLRWPSQHHVGMTIPSALRWPPFASHKLATPKKRMRAKRGRIANQQQLAPCAGHAHVHAADVGQKANLALGVAACQGDGNDVALLALKRIDGAHAEPALQQRVMQPSKAPCAPRHARPRHWQSVGLFAWMACACHSRCVPPRFVSYASSPAGFSQFGIVLGPTFYRRVIPC